MSPDIITDLLFSDKKLEKKDVKLYSPLTLAFLGDAVYSLYVREMLTLTANKPTGKLHKESIEYVNASFQAQMAKIIIPLLNNDELSVFKRGRNAHSSHAPKNQSDADYRYATALETLYGYLFLCGDTERLSYIFKESTGGAYIEKINRDKEKT